MTDPHDPKRLEALDKRIATLKKAQEPTSSRGEEHFSQANMAWRMVIELVAGLGIGFGIGYGLDSLFGTLPIFMLIFTILGLVAGIKTMIRSANEMQEQQLAELAEKNDADHTAKDEGA
jgi:ATP synthase protein I